MKILKGWVVLNRRGESACNPPLVCTGSEKSAGDAGLLEKGDYAAPCVIIIDEHWKTSKKKAVAGKDRRNQR